ncbi:type II toxin-antitoxin system VapB family antitoxin [Microcoleus sp. POL10_C6]|uniref:type II toxin-antitoxin system VapB family antitoxin n=1 Tax=Microcoleus sp. POL10_C6 TaxID=2818852 RepID=UPI002FD3590C
MMQPVILEKLAELPESLQTELLHYIEFLIEKQAKNSTQQKPTKKRRVAGTMKGMFVLPLPDEFDEPLEDMKEYVNAHD